MSKTQKFGIKVIYESQITIVKVDKLRNLFAVENSRLSTPLTLNFRDRVCSTLMKHYVHLLVLINQLVVSSLTCTHHL